MENLENVSQIIQFLFGGEISIDKITTILVAIYAVIKSILDGLSKKKLIKADKEASATETKIIEQEKKISEMNKCIGLLADIVVTAYLSSNTIDTNTKKRIGNYATQIEKVSKLPLSNITTDVINTITNYIPNNSLKEHEEKILEKTKAAEKAIDTVKEAADSLIDKLDI